MDGKKQPNHAIISLPGVAVKNGPHPLPVGTAATLELEMGDLTVRSQAIGATARLSYRQIIGVDSDTKTLTIRYTSLRGEKSALAFEHNTAPGLLDFMRNLKTLAGIHSVPPDAPPLDIVL